MCVGVGRVGCRSGDIVKQFGEFVYLGTLYLCQVVIYG